MSDLAGRAQQVAATLRRAEQIVTELEAKRAELVAEMAGQGWGCAEIGRALGVSRQRAYQLLQPARQISR